MFDVLKLRMQVRVTQKAVCFSPNTFAVAYFFGHGEVRSTLDVAQGLFVLDRYTFVGASDPKIYTWNNINITGFFRRMSTRRGFDSGLV